MMILAQEFHQNLIRYYMDQLASPLGVGFIVVGLFIAALVVAVDSLRWVLLTAAIYLASYSYQRLQNSAELPPPFGYFVQLSQLVPIAMLALILVAVLKPVPWSRRRLLHPAIVFLFILQLYLSFRQITGGVTLKGIFAVCIYTANFLILGIGVSRWLHDVVHARSLCRAISWAAGAMVLCTLAVLVLRLDAAFHNGRLIGTTENAQRIAAFLALALPFSSAVLVDPRVAKPSRVIHGLIAGATAAFLVLTASRTGGLTAAVGLLVFFRRRIGGFAIAGGFILALGLLVSSFFETQFSYAGEHLLRTNNSRAEVWAAALEIFYRSPLVGTPGETVTVESSYISAAASGGVIALVPLAFMLFFLIRSTISLARNSSRMGEYSIFADAVTASIAQFLIIWLFEGYMLGLMTDHLFTFYCVMALLTFLLERKETGAEVASLSDEAYLAHEMDAPHRHLTATA